MNTYELFPEACALVTATVHAAARTDLDRPTPCADFDVRRLVDHVTGTTGALARVGAGEPLDPDDPWGSASKVSDGDWVAALTANLDAIGAGWSQPSAWSGTVDTGGGEMPSSSIGDMALIEVLVHGWDLARAAGNSLVIGDELGAAARRLVEHTAELGRQLEAYGPEVDLDDSAPDFEHALAATGRDPRWTA